jgi:imidazolonepropionase-like amidohydrolase
LGTEGIRNAVLAGVDTIEHGTFLTEDIVAAMQERRTALCPTLVTYRRLAEDPEGAIPAYAVAKARTVVDAHQESFGMALDAGLPIVAGTDSGACQLPHPAVVDELIIMEEYGMPRVRAIRTATTEAARVLGREEELGTIRPGARADLMIVENDPFGDLNALKRVWGVIRNGRCLGDLLAGHRQNQLLA